MKNTDRLSHTWPRNPGSCPSCRDGSSFPPIALALALALALLGLVSARPAAAYPGEPDGFETVRWGAMPQELLEKRPGLQKRGHSLASVKAAMKRHPNGVLLTEIGPYLGFSDAEIRYSVAPTGLFQVELRLVDSAPGSYKRSTEVTSELVQRYGPPTRSEGRSQLWLGEKTVVRLEEEPAISGVSLVLTFTRRSDHDLENR